MIGSVGTQDGLMGIASRVAEVEAASSGFAPELGRWSERANPKIMTEDDARAAAEELVAMTFVQPLLAQMREMNEAAEPFAPGIAERRFGAMWDAEIAQRLVRSRGFGLVDAVAQNVLSKARKGVPLAPTEPTSHGRAETRTIATTI
jgi:Rod binding domain-containing protein